MFPRAHTTRGRLGLSAVALAAATAAHAQPVATANPQAAPISQEQFLQLMGRLDALEKRNGELEAQVQSLKTTSAPAPAPKPDPTLAKATLRDARPTFATADGEFTASLRGIVQLDAAIYDQRPPGPLATDFRRGSLGSAEEADHARDLSDGANFRRMRLGVEGKAWGDWAYNFLVDFGGSGVEGGGSIINAYLEYTGLNPVRLRVGAFAPPISFDDGSSATYILFPERSSPPDILRSLTGTDGRTAAAVMANGERWMFYGGVAGNIAGVSSFDEQLGGTLRATFLPWKTKDGLVHVGVSGNWVFSPAATGPDVPPGGAVTPIRLRDRPEMRVDGTRLIDTGAIDADGIAVYGLEFGWQHKALSLQAEHFWFNLERRNSALADPRFEGWYVAGAWTLTGEMRRYNAATGGLEAVRVAEPFNLKRRDWGAWELAARWSDMDLNYHAGALGTAPAADAVRGGRQQILSLGLNWYPNNNVRFLADYMRVDVNRLSPGGTAFGAGALTPPAGAQVGQELNIWSFRTQYAF